MYRDVAVRGGGMGLLFLLFSTIVISLPIVFSVYSMDEKKGKQIDLFFLTLEPIEINNGELITDIVKPCYYPSIENPNIVVDPNESTFVIDKKQTTIFITRNKLMYRLNEKYPIHTIELSSYKSKGEMINDVKRKLGVATFKKYLNLPVVVVIEYLWRLLWVFISGGVFYSCRRIININVTYKQVVRLAVVSGTPPSVLCSMLYILIPSSQMTIFWLGISISLVFFLFVLRETVKA